LSSLSESESFSILLGLETAAQYPVIGGNFRNEQKARQARACPTRTASDTHRSVDDGHGKTLYRTERGQIQLVLGRAADHEDGRGVRSKILSGDPLDVLASQSDSLSETLRDVSSQTGESFSELGEWARMAALIVYGVVLAVSALVQGLTAFYYHSLRASVEAYAAAPAWARALG